MITTFEILIVMSYNLHYHLVARKLIQKRQSRRKCFYHILNHNLLNVPLKK